MRGECRPNDGCSLMSSLSLNETEAGWHPSKPEPLSCGCLGPLVVDLSDLTRLHAHGSGPAQNGRTTIDHAGAVAFEERDHRLGRWSDPDPSHGLVPETGLLVGAGHLDDVAVHA